MPSRALRTSTQNQHMMLTSSSHALYVRTEPLAQLAEHLTFNQGVGGSIPPRLTIFPRRLHPARSDCGCPCHHSHHQDNPSSVFQKQPLELGDARLAADSGWRSRLPRSPGGRQGRLRAASKDMIRIEWRRRPRRWRGLAVAFVFAILGGGCAPLRTVCAPGTWAPTTAEVTWSPGPHGSGSVPAMSCEAAPK